MIAAPGPPPPIWILIVSRGLTFIVRSTRYPEDPPPPPPLPGPNAVPPPPPPPPAAKLTVISCIPAGTFQV